MTQGSGVRFGLAVAPQVPCAVCGSSNLLQEREVYTYLWAGTFPCDKCSGEIDLWTCLSRYLSSRDRPESALALVGANVPIFSVPIVLDQDVTIAFDTLGVPIDADVMAVFTKAIATDSATIVPRIDLPERLPGSPPHQLRLRSQPLSDVREGRLHLTVVWMPHGEHSAQRQLVDATAQFVEGRLSEMIIPANSAVESALAPLIAGGLQRHAARERVDRFLDVATYAHQLNVLLPVLTNLTGLPPLPVSVRGVLNRLNKLRNDKAHRGHLVDQLTDLEASELLSSAFLGVSYVAMCGPVLIEGRRPRRPRANLRRDG